MLAASVARTCSVVVRTLRKPCLAPAGTSTDWFGPHDRFVVADPDLGLAVDDLQHLFHGVDMGRRAEAGIAILVEDAELPATGERRGPHPRHDAVPPLLQWLILVNENLHGLPFRHSDRGSSHTRNLA